MMATKLIHQRGSADPRELQRALDAILVDLRDHPDAPTSITVAEGSQGADPVLTTIVLTIVARAAEKIFDEQIWPRLKDILADDALGPRERADADSEQ